MSAITDPLAHLRKQLIRAPTMFAAAKIAAKWGLRAYGFYSLYAWGDQIGTAYNRIGRMRARMRGFTPKL